MDTTSLSAAVAGITFARTALGAIVATTVDNQTRDKINEVLTKLGAAQDTMFALRDENFSLQEDNARLKREAADRDDWKGRLAQYDLGITKGSATVYAYKYAPPHYACPSCTNHHRIEILQDKQSYSGLWRCPGCNKEFAISPRQDMPPIEYPSTNLY